MVGVRGCKKVDLPASRSTDIVSVCMAEVSLLVVFAVAEQHKAVLPTCFLKSLPIHRSGFKRVTSQICYDKRF